MKKPLIFKVLVFTAIVAVLATGADLLLRKVVYAPAQIVNSNNNEAAISATDSAPTAFTAAVPPEISAPLPGALNRITKKPFGLYVTPQHSPVSPERFTGYHTGVDFETLPSEQDTDVPVSAVCPGKLLQKEQASGYGGVAVQACRLNNQDVTVVYGHLRLSSIKPPVGRQLSTGQQFAVLGTGYSQETDGERKHLHLAIHKGTQISILGYVQNQNQLGSWLDPRKYLK